MLAHRYVMLCVCCGLAWPRRVSEQDNSPTMNDHHIEIIFIYETSPRWCWGLLYVALDAVQQCASALCRLPLKMIAKKWRNRGKQMKR